MRWHKYSVQILVRWIAVPPCTLECNGSTMKLFACQANTNTCLACACEQNETSLWKSICVNFLILKTSCNSNSYTLILCSLCVHVLCNMLCCWDVCSAKLCTQRHENTVIFWPLVCEVSIFQNDLHIFSDRTGHNDVEHWPYICN